MTIAPVDLFCIKITYDNLEILNNDDFIMVFSEIYNISDIESNHLYNLLIEKQEVSLGNYTEDIANMLIKSSSNAFKETVLPLNIKMKYLHT